ncbi:serine hydrolase domain-containing protein [Xanthomonas maliensis]|uniref:serine hydrolase domain-containing protein n=2 Tax=Xanthomonas maliensis TaxID=1321368 RepID=UPI001FCFE984|nr:serine hydrolase domain-containing protein [Xanthomonas maliensis]
MDDTPPTPPRSARLALDRYRQGTTTAGVMPSHLQPIATPCLSGRTHTRVDPSTFAVAVAVRLRLHARWLRPSPLLCVLLCLLPGGAAATELSRRLDAQLQLNRERYGIAGQAVLIAHDGKVIYQAASGERDFAAQAPMTVDSVFAAQSLAKLFTSTLLMQLVEHRKVDLDAPISRYLPQLPQGWRAIPVRDFLNHSSGVAEYFEKRGERLASPGYDGLAPDLTAALAAAGAAPLQFAPGTRARYTQTNFLVLTALLEAHYRKPYPIIVRERILRPLQLRNTWLGRAAVPKDRAAVAYTGKQGVLQPDDEAPWPSYGWGHADLQTTVGDMQRFLQALAAGRLLQRATLERLWQPQRLSDGGQNAFASGWDRANRDGYTEVGHDGGTRVRVRLAYRGTLAGDCWIFVYFTNGSARNVWSRVLVDSTMATTAPAQFPHAALSERMIAYALDSAPESERALRAWLKDCGIDGAALEPAINTAGYTIRENLGAGVALKVFALNAALHPDSANVWDSLAECHAALGDKDTAERLYAKSRALAKPAR